MTGSRILLVDDDDAARDALARLIASDGHRTVAVGSVPAALRILAEESFDLLITDVRLDTYNGLHILAVSTHPIPAIVITGHDDRSIEADARKLGADYLVKPVSWSTLRQRIAEQLTGRTTHTS